MLVWDDGEIITGHGRVEAAKLLGRRTVPTLALCHLSEAERRVYVLADNKLTQNAGWDRDILAIELQALIDVDFDIELTGFSLAEVDFTLAEAAEADPDGPATAEDAIPVPLGEPPRPVPHPDDIILDPSNGGVRIAGSETKEQRDRLEEALQRRNEAQEGVTYFAQKYKRSRSEKRRAFYLEEWHWEQRMFDIINDIMPARYKAKLENRSYREGASRSGKALDELRADRELRAGSSSPAARGSSASGASVRSCPGSGGGTPRRP